MTELINTTFLTESDIKNFIQVKKDFIDNYIDGKHDKKNNIYHYEFLTMNAFIHFEDVIEKIINASNEHNYKFAILIHTDENNIDSLNDNYKSKLSKLKLKCDDCDHKKIILSM